MIWKMEGAVSRVAATCDWRVAATIGAIPARVQMATKSVKYNAKPRLFEIIRACAANPRENAG
jgi:hypothetical protein